MALPRWCLETWPLGAVAFAESLLKGASAALHGGAFAGGALAGFFAGALAGAFAGGALAGAFAGAFLGGGATAASNATGEPPLQTSPANAAGAIIGGNKQAGNPADKSCCKTTRLGQRGISVHVVSAMELDCCGSGVSAASGGASGRGSTLRLFGAASGGASGSGSGAGTTMRRCIIRRAATAPCHRAAARRASLNQKNNNNKTMKRL